MTKPRVTARSVRTPRGVETIYRVDGRTCASLEAVETALEGRRPDH